MNDLVVKVLEDMRQPLTAILCSIGMIDVVGGDVGNGDIEIQAISRDLETIREQAKRMKDMLQSLQDQAKAATSKTVPDTQDEIDVESLDEGDRLATDIGESLSEALDEVLSESLANLSKEKRQSVQGRTIIFNVSIGDGFYTSDFNVQKGL